MDTDRLKLFLHIVETGSMTAATQRAHLTQPAISRAVKRLEDDLGAALFRKEGRGVALTAAGRALVPRARSLLASHQQVALEVSRTAERGYWDVRLGCVDSVAAFLLPPMLAKLNRAFPELVLRLRTGRTAALLSRLRSGELDVAIVAHSGAIEGLESVRLVPYRLQYYGRTERFAQLANVRTVDELRPFPLVEIEPPPGQPVTSLEADRSHAVVSTAATVKALVLSGVGVGDLTPFMLNAAERKQLTCARIPHDASCFMALAIGQAWVSSEERRLVSWVGAHLKAAARN